MRENTDAMPSEAAVAIGDVAEDRLRRLQRISLELNASLTIRDIAAAVIQVLDTPIAAPSRSLYLLDEGSAHLVLVAQSGMPAEAANRFSRLPLDADLPGSVAVRERRTVVSKGRVDAVAAFPSLFGVPRSTDGFLALPLLGDRCCVGVLGIGFDGTLDSGSIEFLEAVAAQVAQSVIRVRLVENERRRRVELEFLAGLTQTALDAEDHLDLMRRVCEAAVPTLGDWCSLYFLNETDVVPEVAFAHVDPLKTSYVEDLMRRYPFDPNRLSGVPAVMRSGQTEFVPRLTVQVIDDAITASHLSREEVMPIVDRLGITSAITVALRTKKRIVGAMQFVAAESGRHYDNDDVALAEAVAGRLAEALDAAWQADHQRSVAGSLQQALLPPALPTIPGVDIAARYWPAGIDAVGGDFYDVFQVSDSTWAVVIGDVCGTGPDAAAMTGIARHTIRAAARHGATPCEVMEWLNDAVLQSQRDLFCTVCYANLTRDEDGWTFESTVAGHPLPILSTGSGVSAFGTPGTLIGVYEEISVRTEQTMIGSGDVVVLYTDGITDLPSPFGIEPSALASLVHRQRGSSVSETAEAIHRSLTERVPDQRRRDDAAVLIVGLT